MKNLFYNNDWNQGSVQLHVDPLLIQSIKSKNYTESDKNCVKTKLHRDPTSEKSDHYYFKMTFFYNGDS